jgi:hypothetical protein
LWNVRRAWSPQCTCLHWVASFVSRRVLRIASWTIQDHTVRPPAITLLECRSRRTAMERHASSSSPQLLAPSSFVNSTAHHEPQPENEHALARGKRKRTRYGASDVFPSCMLTVGSAEDQAVLEAAYRRDSKPDKAARLELVRQVALGEKEVQVSGPHPREMPN